MIYPLVICYIAIENDPVEIVDLPIENGGSFRSYVNVYQMVILVSFFFSASIPKESQKWCCPFFPLFDG